MAGLEKQHLKVFGRTTDQTMNNGSTTHADSLTKADAAEHLTTDTDLNMRVQQDYHDVQRCSATKFLNDDIEEIQVRHRVINNYPDPAKPEVATISAKNFSINSPSITKMIDRCKIDTSPSFGSGVAAN